MMRRAYFGVATLGLLAASLVAVPLGPASAAAEHGPRTSVQPCGSGWSHETTEPAAGFDPVSASDAELETNGFAPRPADRSSADYREWVTYATGPITRLDGCGEAPRKSSRHTHGASVVRATSGNWAAWEASGHTYTEADATFTVPTVSGVSGQSAYSTHWVGIGEGTSHTYPVAQSGIDANWTGSKASYSAWAEVFWNTGDWQTPLRLSIAAGNKIYVHVAFAGNGTFRMHLLNKTTGVDAGTYTYRESGFTASGNSEFVSERQTVNGSLPRLAKFSTVTWTGPRSLSGGTWTNLNVDGRQQITMKSGSTTLADVTAPTSGDVFTSVWKAYGP